MEKADSMFDDVLEALVEPKTSHFPVSSRLQAFAQPWREEIPAALLRFMSSWKMSPCAGHEAMEELSR